MSEALYGTVTLVVGARSYTLQPTLEAALRIESRFGGLRGGLEAMRLMSIGACADVIIARRGLQPEQHATVATEVFKAGVSKVSNELVRYITYLLNPCRRASPNGESPRRPAQRREKWQLRRLSVRRSHRLAWLAARNRMAHTHPSDHARA